MSITIKELNNLAYSYGFKVIEGRDGKIILNKFYTDIILNSTDVAYAYITGYARGRKDERDQYDKI